MGCVASSPKVTDMYTDNNRSLWRYLPTKEEAKRKYLFDGSLRADSDDELLELRVAMDEPLIMRALSLFAKNKAYFEYLLCWTDIAEFKSVLLSAMQYRRVKMSQIYNKYLRPEAKMKIHQVPNEIMDRLGRSVRTTAINDAIEPSVFDTLQYYCLQRVHSDIYQPFRYTANFRNAVALVKESYNQVTPEDFQYQEILGRGGFGLVVHCRKTSTGKHYAMKIQPKVALLKTYRNALYRVDTERRALSSCSHPFIVSLDYAFQTDTLVFLAIELGSHGTLQQALDVNRKLPVDHVRFYAAEIALALEHIHNLGMIYRDLKPSNILLQADGHIQLCDLGGVVDPANGVLGHDNDGNEFTRLLFSHEFRRSENSESKANTGNIKTVVVEPEHGIAGNVSLDGSYQNETSVKTMRGEGELARAKSVMGTDGFMAFEILALRNRSHGGVMGYTNAVDWWSLGALMFVCLTGNFPYSTMNCFYVDELLIKLQKDSKYINGVKALIDSDLDLEEWPNEYKRIESMLRFVSGMDNTVKDAVLRLLDLNDRTRLGSHATGGVGALKQHDVFKLNLKIHNHSKPTVCSPPAENNPDSQSEAFCFYDFCWSAIEGKQLMAPPVPVSVELSNSNVFKKFDKFMDSASSDERLWLEQHPSTYLNDFFSSWDYISKGALKFELNISEAVRQYDRKYKARQILGSLSSPPADKAKNNRPHYPRFSAKIDVYKANE